MNPHQNENTDGPQEQMEIMDKTKTATSSTRSRKVLLSSKNIDSSEHLLAGTFAVLNQAKLSKDVMHPLSLRFRDKTIEELFLQEHAIAYKRIVYAGYFLQLFLGALGVLISKMIIKVYKLDACAQLEDVAMTALCQKMLGNRFISKHKQDLLRKDNSTLARNILDDVIEQKASDPLGLDITDWISYDPDDEANYKYVKTEDVETQASVIAGMVWLMLVCLVGSILHWRIHWKAGKKSSSRKCGGAWCVNHRKEVKAKAWATRVACICYTVELVGFCVLSLIFHSFDAFWELTLFLWYMFILLIGAWFTGMLFLHTLTLCAFATVAFYGSTLPIVFFYKDIVKGSLNTLEEIEPIFEVVMYASVALLNLLFTALVLISAYANETTARRSFLQSFMIYYQQDKMIMDRTSFEKIRKEMLEKILPPFVVEELISEGKSAAPAAPARLRTLSRRHDSVSILFADVVGFSSFAKQVDASFVMQYLNNLFQAFDDLTEIHDVYKVETIGDCYVATVGLVTGQMLCSGLSENSSNLTFRLSSMYANNSTFRRARAVNSDSLIPSDLRTHGRSRRSRWSADIGKLRHSDSLSERTLLHRLESLGPNDIMKTSIKEEDVLDAARENTVKMLRFAKAMIAHSATVQKPLDNASTATSMRIGVHTGPCLSGIVGARNVRFCLLGETVTIASKFEQTGSADKIHASDIVQTLTPEEDWKESTGQAFRGRTIQDYLLDCKK